MLYPQENKYRENKLLTGFWDNRFDKDETGRKKKWFNGFEKEGELPVPGSWNELFSDEEHMHFMGTCWYQKKVFIPEGWNDRKIWIRVGAVSYRAEVWLNGKRAGSYDDCHMPFEFNITDIAETGAENLIVIAVNAKLGPDTLPVGGLNNFTSNHETLTKSFPDVQFDFFPYGGIHRPVILHTTPKEHITGLVVNTGIKEKTGKVEISVKSDGNKADRVEIELAGRTASAKVKNGAALVNLDISNARFWSPEDPHLYEAKIKLFTGKTAVDEYIQNVGIRTVEVRNEQILVNGKPVFMRGFGKHEDFSVIGKGLNHSVIKKDFEMMKWLGANSFRTTHYPYAEEVLDMADREGFLVISESAAVGLPFKYDNSQLLKRHKRVMEELVARDRNHPSIIMWSVANEPRTDVDGAAPYFKTLIDLTHKLDKSRPVTVVTCFGTWMGGKPCKVIGLCDVLCINRYYGWYVGSGQLKQSMKDMDKELDEIFKKYKRPVIMTEFGADCVAGLHSLPGFPFSEEYQAELLEGSIKVLESKDYVAGEHIWNFADFMTGHTHTRAVGNKKGIFTRDRQPKLAAHVVKKLWKDKRAL